VGPALLLASSSSGGAPEWVKVVAIVVGLLIVGAVLVSAVETVVLPRNSFTRITRATFAVTNRLMVHRWHNRARGKNLRALYGPVALVSLPLVWMLTVIIGFSLLFWGFDAGTLERSFEISGSSVTTLGFAAPTGGLRSWTSFIEAIIGLGLVALLISYLPTIYAAHHDREKGISTLRPFTGTPASGVDMLATLHTFDAIDNPDLWRSAMQWLLELDQTHCSFPALCYFPETSSEQSWVASVGALLDAGSLLLSGGASSLTGETAVRLQGPLLMLAHGIPTVSEIGRASGLPIPPPVRLAQLLPEAAQPPPPISVTRTEFDAAIDRLADVLPDAVADRDAAWRRFAWARSSYDQALRGLAGLTLATPAPWTTDRPAAVGRPRLVTNKPIKVDWRLPDQA
jgi:hypothetical protein